MKVRNYFGGSWEFSNYAIFKLLVLFGNFQFVLVLCYQAILRLFYYWNCSLLVFWLGLRKATSFCGF